MINTCLKRNWFAIALIGMLLTSCLPENPAPMPTAAPPTPTIAPTSPSTPATSTPNAQPPTPTSIDYAMLDLLAQPSHARGYLTTPNELLRIARLANLGIEPYRTSMQETLRYAENMLKAKPLEMPDEIDIRDSDIENPEYLHKGSQYVYTWALAYNLLRETDPIQAERYAQAAHELVMEMPRADLQVSGYQKNTRLNIAAHISQWVYAADLLADWPTANGTPFAESDDAQILKGWLARTIIRYPYNAAYLRANNWGAWGRLSTAVIADYVGDASPLYVQGLIKTPRLDYQVDPAFPCEGDNLSSCQTLDASTVYANALTTHIAYVDGELYEYNSQTCDGTGSKSMIRPDGGMPDEIRRSYNCDTTTLEEPYDAAARYSQFALDAMISLAELAWRRGDPSIYTHINTETNRGALYRALRFLIDNNVRFEHSSLVEIANRFYTYQLNVEANPERRAELQALVARDLPGLLKSQGQWPADINWVLFGTLTHGFAPEETLHPPPTVPPR
jgi:hypothetical protein